MSHGSGSPHSLRTAIVNNNIGATNPFDEYLSQNSPGALRSPLLQGSNRSASPSEGALSLVIPTTPSSSPAQHRNYCTTLSISLWDGFIVLMHLIGTTYLTALISGGGTAVFFEDSVYNKPTDQFNSDQMLRTLAVAAVFAIPSSLIATRLNYPIGTIAQIQKGIEETKKYSTYAHTSVYKHLWYITIAFTLAISSLVGLINTFMIILATFRSYNAFSGLFGSKSQANQDTPGILLVTMPILIFMALYTEGNIFWISETILNFIARFLMPKLHWETRQNGKRIENHLNDLILLSRVADSVRFTLMCDRLKDLVDSQNLAHLQQGHHYAESSLMASLSTSPQLNL